MSGRCCHGQTPSRDIPGPGKCLALPDEAPLPPGDYSTTPGGTLFGTTPGGERRAGGGRAGGSGEVSPREGRLALSEGLQGRGSAPVLSRDKHREPPPGPGARWRFGGPGQPDSACPGVRAGEPGREQPRPPHGY